jgi:hypothetical protein
MKERVMEWQKQFTKQLTFKRKTKAITPSDIKKLVSDGIPDQMVRAFNSLIVKNWDGHKAIVTHEEAAERAKGLFYLGDGITVQDIYDRHWLDVALIFEARGWHVTYNHINKHHFTFTKKD